MLQLTVLLGLNPLSFQDCTSAEFPAGNRCGWQQGHTRMIINPYLTFNGTCAEAFERYAEIFGAQITFMQKFSDAPMGESMPAGSADRVMHARIEFENAVLMASDAHTPGEVVYSGISVQMSIATVGEAKRVFDALAEGGEIGMPFGSTFWSAGFGSLTDRFGIPWLINCDEPSE